MKEKIRLCLFMVMTGIIPSHGQWSSTGDANKGTQWYTSGGVLGYSIRTSAGGGWAWQFIEGTNIPYFHVEFPSGNVGIGTATPRGKLDVSSGDIYLNQDPINGAGQSIFLPGHIYIGPHASGGTSYLQARRSDNSGTTQLCIRTMNSGSLTEAMYINGAGNVGLLNTNPQARLDLGAGSVAIQDNNQYKLRGGNNAETALGFIPAEEEVRISHTRDAYNRYISLGGYSSGGTTWYPQFKLNTNNGNIGIGTAPSSTYKLSVNGKTWTTEVNVSLTVPAPDYVFDKAYKLPSIESVKQFIDANQHLPEVPSAKEMEVTGINVSEMNMTLLKKVEELTLYVIELQRQIDEMKKAR